jgi:signal transduction histidine kinase
MTLISTASEPSQVEARTHAIKNCISVIHGLASTIERHVDPVARPRVAQLVDASRRLQTLLVRQAMPCDGLREKVRVLDILQLVIDRLKPLAETRGVQLALECAGGTLFCDLGELAEALYNLGANALHASPSGTMVRFTTRRSTDGDHEWSVEDVGCGISARVMPQLGTVGVTTREEGMGLGLSLALQAITRHEGAMRIESTEGRGTTVIIWLPGTSTELSIDGKVESSGCAVNPALEASVNRVLDDV